MFWSADEAGVDAEGCGVVAERLEHSRRRRVEPRVDALRSSPDDGSELPVEALAEPADHGEGIEAVFFDFLGLLGFAAIEAVEVEDDVWGGEHIAGGSAAFARPPDRGRGHGADVGLVLPCCHAAPVVRMAGATVENVAGPDDGVRWEERGHEMPRVELHQFAVDPLRTGFPDISRCRWVAGDDLSPLFLDGGKEALPFLGLTSLCSAFLPPVAVMVRIPFACVRNARERENTATVLSIPLHGCATELAGWENRQVISLPVAAALGTGRAAGGGLALGMADLFQAGEIEAG